MVTTPSGPADVVQEAPTRAAERIEGPGRPVLGAQLGGRATAGGPAAAAQRHPGAGTAAGNDAGQPRDLVAVEDEDDEADGQDTEPDGQLGQRTTCLGAGAPGGPVISVQIGWLIVHSHPPVKSTARRCA